MFFGAIPFGYGWIFPKRDKINIGIGGQIYALREPIEKFNAFKHFIEKKFKIELAKAPIMGHLIPGKLIKYPVFDKILFVGDSAGLVDPFSGEGISYALASGFEAGRIIAEGLEFPVIPSFYEPILEKYTQFIKNEISPELKIARKIAKLMQRKRIRRWIIKKIKETPEIYEILATSPHPYSEIASRSFFMKLIKRLPI